MRSAVILVALAACHRTAAAPPIATPRAAMPRDAAGQVKQVIEDWRKAYESRSVDALEALYAHDADTMIVSDGVPYIGWASVDPALRDRIANTREIHITLKEVQVATLAPGAAVAIATLTMMTSRDAGDGTTSVHEYGALTLVLANGDAGWRIVAEHYSYKRSR